MTEHDPRFDRWDAAYVLGALSTTDRRAYEEHLAGCSRCRAEVADLNGLPGLLHRLPDAQGLSLLEPAVPSATPDADAATSRARIAPPEPAAPEPPADLADRLLRSHRLRSRRRVWTAVGAGLAAAVVAVVAVLGLRGTSAPVATGPAPTLVAELRPAGPHPVPPEELSGSVRLYAKAWGTEVDTECRHRVDAAQPPEDEQYGVYVIDAQGSATLVSSWRSVPKSPIVTTAATATTIGQMRRIELRLLPDQTVLLSATIG